MPRNDPFSKKKTLQAIVKNMEKRWGLTLVSFLPPGAQKCVASLQREISNLAYGAASPCDPFIEFYGLSHLHSTHLTLRRSDGWGPVKEQDFVKAGHRLSELFEIIQGISSQVTVIRLKLDRLRMSPDGLGFILVGKTSDDKSAETRAFLLATLNRDLPRAFNLSRRHWDTDASKYPKVHCRIGFLKRPVENYEGLAQSVEGISFSPIRFTIKEIAIIHHRDRSLRPPHAGDYSFPLGPDAQERISKGDFVRKLNLG